MFVTYPAYIREKAIELRVVKQLSVNEIAERLAISKATIYGWVGDVPLQRPRRENARVAGEVTRAKHAALRQAAYDRGMQSWPILSADPTFRDFVTLFIAEGYKRSRNVVKVSNSDPAVIALSARWMRTLSKRPLKCSVQYHVDQDPAELQAFWGDLLGIRPELVKLQRKSNSGQLSGRQWRSEHGVLQVWVGDTYLRSRMQAWVDSIKRGWV